MGRLTKEQIAGTRFEIWFEQLLKDNGYWSVRRNINYHRSRYRFRQVDVEYKDFNLLNRLVICELKYCRNGQVRLELRKSRKKSGQVIDTIDNIVSELEERRKFVHARKAILVTNRHFTDDTHREAEHYERIEVYERTQLEELEKKRRGFLSRLFPPGTAEEQMENINLRKYDLKVIKEKVGMF